LTLSKDRLPLSPIRAVSSGAPAADILKCRPRAAHLEREGHGLGGAASDVDAAASTALVGQGQTALAGPHSGTKAAFAGTLDKTFSMILHNTLRIQALYCIWDSFYQVQDSRQDYTFDGHFGKGQIPLKYCICSILG
jgi:hypothetical protein